MDGPWSLTVACSFSTVIDSDLPSTSAGPLSSNGKYRTRWGRTRRYIVVRLQRDIVSEFYHVDRLENVKALADSGDADALEGFRVHHAENVAGNPVFCVESGEDRAGQGARDIPFI